MATPELPDKEVRLGWTKLGEQTAQFSPPSTFRDQLVTNLMADPLVTEVWYRIGAFPVVYLKGGPPKWEVQLGKGKGSYKTEYTLHNERQAMLYYSGLNVHSGYKKRLLLDGVVVLRCFS